MSFGANASRIVAVQSAFPSKKFTQAEVGELLGVQNPVVHKLLAAPHIQTRHLDLDAEPRAPGDTTPHQPMPRERLSDLHSRFLRGIRTFGYEAVEKALSAANIAASSIGVVVTVTSSGLALPGISAMLMKDLGLNKKAHRSDIVGMGCNAGLSGLRTLNMLLAAYPTGTIGLLLCVEVSSALYVRDETVGTGIVNSLFGDAAVATIVIGGGISAATSPPPPPASPIAAAGMSTSSAMMTTASSPGASSMASSLSASPIASRPLSPEPSAQQQQQQQPTIRLHDFETESFPELFDDMRYDVDPEHDLYSFKLSKRIPQAVGDAVPLPVNELLERHNLTTADVKHWAVHTGGAAVMDAVVKNLGLADSAIRHTRSVMRDFGNVSSGSFLVSLERLMEEDKNSNNNNSSNGAPVIKNGDLIVFLAMGPGTTIEVALGSFAL